MQNRKPFQLKEYLVAYNIFQVLACLYMLKTMLGDKEAPPLEYFSRCQIKQTFRHPSDLYHFTCFVYALKVSEMSETVVFVLRKKWNQISFLHVFHHSVMVMLSFMGGYSGCCKYLLFSSKMSANLFCYLQLEPSI